MDIKELNNQRRNAPWREELRKSLPPKERMAITPQRVKIASPEARKTSMQLEVNQGFTLFEAQLEAQRCLDCINASCIQGCPAHLPIPSFIKTMQRGKMGEALSLVNGKSWLSSVCSRVCAQEKQCEGHCIYNKMRKTPVRIGAIERFIGDYARQHPEVAQAAEHVKAAPNGKRVAVIGAGPAGLAFAGEMVKAGYEVHVYEKQAAVGGVIRYGIPDYRLPIHIVDEVQERMERLGVHFHFNIEVGKDISAQEMNAMGYQYVFVGSGVVSSRMMHIEGEQLQGVISANEFLYRVNVGEISGNYFEGKRVGIIGGGNTAMDTSRTAVRLGADEVFIIYRRDEEQMPAGKLEIREAHEEGIIFKNLHNPLRYEGSADGQLQRVLLQKMQLTEKDESGRRSFVAIEGATEYLDLDVVIVSIGSTADGVIAQAFTDLDFTKWGTVAVDEDTQQASLPTFYSGGDAVRGGATVVHAMHDGMRAAQSIIERDGAENQAD